MGASYRAGVLSFLEHLSFYTIVMGLVANFSVSSVVFLQTVVSRFVAFFFVGIAPFCLRLMSFIIAFVFSVSLAYIPSVGQVTWMQQNDKPASHTALWTQWIYASW